MTSANRKTSVLSEVTRPLISWEAAKRDAMAPEIKEMSIRRGLIEARIKGLRGKYSKAKPGQLSDIEKEIIELEQNLEDVPVAPKVWAQDITPEHLGTLMGIHNECMSIMLAEGGIFDILGGRYSKGIPNLDLFLQSHAGDSVRVDRGSRDSITLDAPCLTMALCPQPDVLKGLMEKPGFAGRGLLARFLYLLPKSNLGFRSLNGEPIPYGIRDQYSALIHTLLNIERETDNNGKVLPYSLRLSTPAYLDWLEFARATEVQLRDGGRFEYVRAWAGKLPGAASRIAGLLHCAINPFSPWETEVSEQTMGQALSIAATFSHHAIAAHDLMGADKGIEGARKVWAWVKRKSHTEFIKNQCWQDLKGSFPRVALIDEPLSILEERGYIRMETKQTGGRPSIICRVNPKVAS